MGARTGLMGLMLAAGMVCLSSDSSGARAQSKPAQLAPVAPLAPNGPGFNPNVARLADESVERLVLQQLEGAERDAARVLARAAMASAKPAQRGRLLWLVHRASDAKADSVKALQELASMAHPLSSWAGLELAERLRRQEPQRALSILEPLRDGWGGAARARHLYALALEQAGRPQEAEQQLRELLRTAPLHVGGATSAMPLAELLAKKKERGAREEALALYRRVATRAPLSDVGKRARGKEKALLKSLAPARRRALAKRSVEDTMFHGQALMNARRHKDAEALFATLAKRLKKEPRLRCRAELERGRALLRQRKRKEGAELMDRLARRCDEIDVKAWAHYYGGRARVRLNDPNAGLAHYRALQAEAAGHRLADDAAHREALALLELGDEQGMEKALQTLLSRYPDGDMRGEALFTLAWRARTRGDHKGALTQLERLLSEGGGEPNEGMRGRAAYWRARTLQALGRRGEALEAHAALVRSRPLSYHAQQSLTRLRELDAARAQAMQTELGAQGPTGELRFAPRAELHDRRFLSAVALLQVGETALAKRELRHLGALGGEVDAELGWLAAALLHRAGAFAEAANLARRRLGAFMEQMPRGRARHLWRIAYPRAFSPLIEQAAGEANVPPEFVRAVAREESGFNPAAVSSAHAYGLIQLIRPTAKHHAKALGLPSDAASLKKPEINLRIGSSFIRYLWKRYSDNPAVVPAAYNAGHGAADRWLRQRGDKSLDEWIESIPFGETRRYTRRVLQSYGIYAWLDTGRLPELRATLPKR